VAELGIKNDRVIVAGFSQGGATSLALGLGLGLSSPEASSTPSLAGVACLSGYLPAFPVPTAAAGSGTKFFLARGTKDMLVPGWVGRQSVAWVEEVVGKERVREEVYEGMGHGIVGKEMKDFGEWMGSVLGME
jgi:predicted esterase